MDKKPARQPILPWIKSHKISSLGLAMLFLISLIISANSFIATYFLRSFLQEHATDVEIKDLNLSLWQAELSISGLMAKDSQDRQVKFDELAIGWNYNDLFDDQLTIEKFSIQGLKLDIASAQLTPLQIGPIRLADLASTDLANAEQPATPGEPWSVTLQNFMLEETQVCLTDSQQTYRNTGLPINNGAETIDLCLSFDSLSLAEKLVFSRQQQVSYLGNITLRKLMLETRAKAPVLKVTELMLDSLDLQPQALSLATLTLTELGLLAQSKEASHSDLGASFDQLKISGLKLGLEQQSLSLNNAELDNLLIRHKTTDNKRRPLLKVAAFKISQFTQQPLEMAIDAVSLSKIQLMDNFMGGKDEAEYLTSLESITVDKIKLNQRDLAIVKIKLATLDANLAMSQNGLNAANWLAVNEEAPIVEQPNNLENMPDLSISLDSFELDENSKVSFVEIATGKKITHQLSNIAVSLSQLLIADNATETATLAYQFNVGESGRVEGKGILIPNLKSPKVTIDGNISSLNLVELSHYAARFIGYRIERGQLNVGYSINIADDKIDANLDTRFEKFELDTLESHEKSELNQELGVPLPTALNLLRDSEDNIELDFPIKGDIDSPDFSIASVISTVSVKAIKNAVIYNYSPLGMLSLAGGLFDLATALRFDPIRFSARSLTLDDEARIQLEKIIQVMQEKPKIKMVICGVASPMDLEPPAETSPQPEATQTPIAIDPLPLIEWAKQRQAIIIDFISDKGKIEKSRLLSCNVKLDDNKDSSPRVEISI